MSTDKKNPGAVRRWSDLGTTEKWEAIARDKRMRAEIARTLTIGQAVALTLPANVMYAAIEEMSAKGDAFVRQDVQTAILAAIAHVASLLPEKKRDYLIKELEGNMKVLRYCAFFTSTREFLYAAAAAFLRLVEAGCYPPDSPAVPAALLVVNDVLQDEGVAWGIDPKHASTVAGHLFDALMRTGYYAPADG